MDISEWHSTVEFLNPLSGYNTSLFGYGQTGSGKTFTMMGSENKLGIIPRFYTELLYRLKEFHDSKMISASSVEISFFEIYNERIHDLLTDDPKVGFFYSLVKYILYIIIIYCKL